MAYVHIHEDTGRFGENLNNKVIIYAKYAEIDFIFGGESLTIIHEDNVLAVLEESEPT